LGNFKIQSGCFSYNSLFGFAISGSIQMPNFTPFFSPSAITGFNPLGSLVLFSSQSPSPARSSLRGYLLANHPSSSKNKSNPSLEASPTKFFRLSSLKSKYVVSQLFNNAYRLSFPRVMPYFLT